MQRVSNTSTLVSFAQNREDVVLWRALMAVPNGRYVDVGANQPGSDSVSRAFYDRGWRGIAVEPVPALAEAFAAERPRDVVVQAAITDADVETVTLHAIAETGLSSISDEVGDRHRASGLPVEEVQVPAKRLDAVLDMAGWDDVDIHFLVVDVEGAEAAVLRSLDLSTWKPWVVVVESTSPRETRQTHGEWEQLLTDAGYRFCLFDGLSRFYASPEHPELTASLSYPACPHDDYILLSTVRDHEQIQGLEARIAGLDESVQSLTQERDDRSAELTALTVRWRTAALSRWADASVVNHDHSADLGRIDALQKELMATKRTVSWRVTAPLRAARRLTRP